jgi:hypothetical protein
MVSSDLDRTSAGAVRNRRDVVSEPATTVVIGGRRPADPFGADLWVAMLAWPRDHPAFMGGRDRPGHDGSVGMGAPDNEPAGRRPAVAASDKRRKRGRFTVNTVKYGGVDRIYGGARNSPRYSPNLKNPGGR